MSQAWPGSEPRLCPLFAGPTLQGSLAPSIQWMKILVHLSWGRGQGWRRPPVKEQLRAWLECGEYTETCRKEGHFTQFHPHGSLAKEEITREGDFLAQSCTARQWWSWQANPDEHAHCSTIPCVQTVPSPRIAGAGHPCPLLLSFLFLIITIIIIFAF